MSEPVVTSPSRSPRADARVPLLFSIDFEDWHQLVRRRVGAPGWERGGPALEGQTSALLALLDALGARATFFILGMSARRHPELVREVAARGHELGSHGDAHEPVHRQTPETFAADLRRSVETIGELTGRRPIGYRAPYFSITRSARWAFDVLAAEGFVYDSSQHDSPRIGDRITPAQPGPHRIELAQGRSLWEFPVAVWRAGRAVVPVGGGTYWGVLPVAVVVRGLRAAGPHAALYAHPHEFDPRPLRAGLGRGAPVKQRILTGLRSVQREAARRHVPLVLRAVGERFALMPYGEAHAQLDHRA